jgi:hypothetical protein
MGFGRAKFWPPCGGWGGMYGGLGLWPSPSRLSLRIFDETSLAFCVRNMLIRALERNEFSSNLTRLRIISRSVMNGSRNGQIHRFRKRLRYLYLNSSLKFLACSRLSLAESINTNTPLKSRLEPREKPPHLSFVAWASFEVARSRQANEKSKPRPRASTAGSLERSTSSGALLGTVLKTAWCRRRKKRWRMISIRNKSVSLLDVGNDVERDPKLEVYFSVQVSWPSLVLL